MSVRGDGRAVKGLSKAYQRPTGGFDTRPWQRQGHSLRQRAPVLVANRYRRAAPQHRLAIAVGKPAKLDDTLSLHDRRAVHANEVRRIEGAVERVQCGAHQISLRAGMQAHIVALRLDPL